MNTSLNVKIWPSLKTKSVTWKHKKKKRPLGDRKVSLLTKLSFNESQQMFLVHAGGMVHMIIDFAYIVEITMRHQLGKFKQQNPEMSTITF
jgi:hypothetical protein